MTTMSSSSLRIGLDGTEVAEAFPFHFAIDAQGRITQVGDVLERIVPDLVPGTALDDHFEVIRPADCRTFEDMRAHRASVFLLQHRRQRGLRLKGQMLALRSGRAAIFLGSPWVTAVSQLGDLSLRLSDFAVHDCVPDYLMLLQTQQTSLADLDRLTQELEALNAALEKRAMERGRALAHANEQLRQGQKMEAIGRLAGGVAHDFNNLLTVILSSAEMVLEQLEHQHAARADLEEIRKAAESAALLTKQLLAFSRKQVLQPRVVNLNDVVRRVDSFLDRIIGEDIELVTSLDEHLGPVMVDPGQMEQVLMNLATNARDAMPGGGRLIIETGSAEVSVADVDRNRDLSPGPHAVLTVGDTGIGMDAATQDRIFEPFFTTKGHEKGTGLGLATVFGIVKQSRGSITVESEPGKGTRFRVYLPVVAAPANDASAPPIAAGANGGPRALLLVDDEPVLRRILRRALAIAGYTVLEAGDGAEALAVFQQHSAGIQLLLTDIVMPAMNGRELAERILATHPDVRVVFMSGYTEGKITGNGVPGGAAFLEKPFTPDVLLAKVREVLLS